MAERCGGSISQRRSMSATKLDLRSWKPTSTALLATNRTDSRAR